MCCMLERLNLWRVFKTCGHYFSSIHSYVMTRLKHTNGTKPVRGSCLKIRKPINCIFVSHFIWYLILTSLFSVNQEFIAMCVHFLKNTVALRDKIQFIQLNLVYTVLMKTRLENLIKILLIYFIESLSAEFAFSNNTIFRVEIRFIYLTFGWGFSICHNIER